MSKKTKQSAGIGNHLYGIIIFILCLILVVMSIIIVRELTEPASHFEYEGDYLLHEFQRGEYGDTVLSAKRAIVQGKTPEMSNDYKVAFTILEYFEAASYYKGHLNAGDKEGAEQYKQKMQAAHDKLGEFEFMAEEVDEYLDLN